MKKSKKEPTHFDWGLLSEKGAREADEYLRNLPGFDYEAWQKREGPKELLEKKFGSSEQCLSILTLSVLRKMQAHLKNCDACRQEVKRWEKAQKKNA